MSSVGLIDDVMMLNEAEVNGWGRKNGENFTACMGNIG